MNGTDRQASKIPGGGGRKRPSWRSRLWLAVITGLLPSVTVDAQEYVAVTGGTIIPISGDRIESGTVLIADGRIQAVGADVNIPVSAKVIDVTGKVVMPGIINVHSSAGMSQANEQNAVVPFLSVVDSIDPISDFFEESRRNGVTTANVVPGNSTMIGGRAAIVKTAGQYVNDMVVKRDAGLKISLEPASGTSRMSHLARLRRELREAQEAASEDDADDSDTEDSDADDDDGSDDDDPDEDGDDDQRGGRSSASAAQRATEKAAREALQAMLRGDVPAIIYCQQPVDVTRAFELVDEFGLKPILVLGRECDKAADAVAARNVPVILDDTLVYWRTDPRTREDEKIVLPKIFADSGAKFLFQTADSGTSQATHYHWYQAATAVRYGMPVDAALRALTLDAAELLGLADSVGSIEKGKDADLVILTGDPLSVSTWVDMTIIDGDVVYQRSEDERLQRLFEPEKDVQ